MGLLNNIHNESVARLPLRKALLVQADEPIQSAISIMKSNQLGCVIAVNDQGLPLGTFTERCVVDLLANNPQAIKNSTIRECLDTKWSCVSETAPVSAVVKALQIEDLRFVVVVDKNKKPIALTGQKGLMEYVAEHYPQQTMVQRVGAKPPKSREGA